MFDVIFTIGSKISC